MMTSFQQKVISSRQFVGLATFMLSSLGAIAHGQVTLYDNLDNLIDDTFWIDALGPDRRSAQQFLMGDNTIVDSVTLRLQRTGTAPTGSLGIELWRDNGANAPLPVGDPSAKLADIGTIDDVTQLPVASFANIPFDNLSLELEPNSPYWIVVNFSGVSGLGESGNGVGWGVAVDDDNIPAEVVPPGYDALVGTNGAAFANLYRDADPDWIDAATALGGNAVFFSMSVQAVPEPSSATMLLVGLVALGSRGLRGSSRAGPVWGVCANGNQRRRNGMAASRLNDKHRPRTFCVPPV